MSHLESLPVWPEIVRLKDDLPLAALAKRFRTTAGAISAALERTSGRAGAGAAADDLPPEPGDARTDDDMLPEVDRALRSLRAGSKDMLISEHASLLGRVPDADVAKAAGVSIRTIASFRSRHEIPGYSGPRRKPESSAARRSRIDAYAHLLGKVPDHVIAEKAGVTVHAVRSYRSKHGITTLAHDAPRTPSSTSRLAWRVSWRSGSGRRHGVLLALDLDDALLQLQRAGMGDVVGLDLLGSVVE